LGCWDQHLWKASEIIEIFRSRVTLWREISPWEGGQSGLEIEPARRVRRNRQVLEA
jgi:hypothetical protein